MSSRLLTAPVELSDTELDAVAAGWGSCNPCDNGISVKADVSANVCLASPTGRTSRVEPTRSCELEAPKWGLAASAELRRTCVGRFHLRAGSDAMRLANRFKQRRADFIAALARDHDSGLGELFRLYWLSGMDAADLFFKEFGPGAFWQEHMDAEKKSILGKMQTIVLDYVDQFPDSPKRIGMTSKRWRAPSLTQPSMPVLLKGIRPLWWSDVWRSDRVPRGMQKPAFSVPLS